jgi:hypothetical protein
MSSIKIVLGACQALINYWLISDLTLGPAATVFIYALCSIPLFALQIKLPAKETIPWALPMLMVLALVYAYIAYRFTGGRFCANELIPQTGISLFIFLTFYFTIVEEKRLAFPYPTLFNEAWKTILKIILGSLFAMLAWGLFFFAAILFDMLSIHFIIEIVTSSTFQVIMPAFFFGIAMYALDNYESLIIKLRDILLFFCKWLYPLCLIISLCFLITVPFSPKPIADYWMVINVICSINILLFNGVYQDGLSQSPYSRWVTPVINASFIIMAVYSIYILKFSIQDAFRDVLDIHLFISMITMVLLAMYPVTYSLAICFSNTRWLDRIKEANITLAFLIACIYLLLALFLPCLHTPNLLDTPRDVIKPNKSFVTHADN